MMKSILCCVVVLWGCESPEAKSDASPLSDIVDAANDSTETNTDSGLPWPSSCSPPALFVRLRSADGGIQEGCYVSEDRRGLPQNFSNCQAAEAEFAGVRDGWRVGVASYNPPWLRGAGERQVQVAFYPPDRRAEEAYYSAGASCRVRLQAAVFVGDEVRFELVAPCSLPRQGNPGSVVTIESMSGRASVVLGDVRVEASHDAGPADCGVLR